MAKDGYEKAKRDMKQLTPIMRKIRKEIDAHLVWDSSGNIRSIELYSQDDTRVLYPPTFPNYIKTLKDEHEINKILLGETCT